MSKSTRKRIHQSREEVEELKDRLAKIEGAQSQDQDLETSQTAVAKLKEIITQMKQERAAERKALEDRVKQHVTQALQAQFKSFAQEMSSTFAQMMMTDHIAPKTQSNVRPATRRILRK